MLTPVYPQRFVYDFEKFTKNINNMGWGTEFTCTVYVDRKYFDSIEALKLEILQCEEDIISYKEKIKMFASGNVKDLVPKEWEVQPIDFVHTEVTGLLDTLSETEDYLTKLYLASKNFKSKTED